MDLMRSVLEWARVVFGPGRGRHRAGSGRVRGRHAALPRAPRCAVRRVPARPVMGPNELLDADGVALVRPYRVAAERAAGRRTLVGLVTGGVR